MKNTILLVAVILLATSLFPQNTFADNHKNAGSSAQLHQHQLSTASVLDTRVVALQNIFKKYNSPLVPEAEYYVKYADKYDIDWRLLPAIAGLESGFARAHIEGSHNAYGWGRGRIYYTSWEEGIDTISKALAERYYARGADTVEKIGPIYAESPTWAVRVNNYIYQIESEYVKLNAESALALNI
jgi:hypothetical protein